MIGDYEALVVKAKPCTEYVPSIESALNLVLFWCTEILPLRSSTFGAAGASSASYQTKQARAQRRLNSVAQAVAQHACMSAT